MENVSGYLFATIWKFTKYGRYFKIGEAFIGELQIVNQISPGVRGDCFLFQFACWHVSGVNTRMTTCRAALVGDMTTNQSAPRHRWHRALTCQSSLYSGLSGALAWSRLPPRMPTSPTWLGIKIVPPARAVNVTLIDISRPRECQLLYWFGELVASIYFIIWPLRVFKKDMF